MALLPYDRRDADSILEYLKSKAEEISGGRWTDFSNGDIGTVLLKLIAYIADMNNYQIDKALAELYIDSLTERDSAISLTKLIGYEPRGYKSSRVYAKLTLKPGHSITDGTEIVFLGLPGGGVCILAKSGVAYYEIAAEVNKEN